MSEFKVPVSIPQDLLLIQEMVGVEPAEDKVDQAMPSENEDIASSDGENSEDEIEAKLVEGAEDSDLASPKSASEPFHSSSESSEDEFEDEGKHEGVALDQAVDDEDEDAAPNAGTGTYFQTKHEVVETEIAIPEADEVDPEESLEKVGEIMTILDQVAIVRGLPSNNMARGSEKALDSDTLLVFDDRNVMGYIYETFGPTNQPLYQVKYNSKYPLDPERVKTGREVFMVPSKSKFVFVDQIKIFKGSDASNVYDEEPADDELEFSDDETEAMYKSRMKRKRGESRARSVAQSREPTPNPSHMRDHQLVDDVILSRNAWDEHGPYDLDFSSSEFSRPAPIPYDDPYSMPCEQPAAEGTSSMPPHPPKPAPRQETRPRGRGRGGNIGQSTRGRGGRGGGRDLRRGGPLHSSVSRSSEIPKNFSDAHSPHTPAQMDIGQQYYQQDFGNAGMQSDQPPPGWGYPQMPGMMQQSFAGQNTGHQRGMPYVQPHINPLFAPAFGFPMGQGQNIGYSGQFGMVNSYSAAFPGAAAGGYEDHQRQQQQWSGQWATPANGQHPPGGQGQG